MANVDEDTNGAVEENGAESAAEPDSAVPRGPERTLFWWFCGLMGVNVASIVWLALRAESPSYLRGILDVFLQGATGAVVAYFAFRALFLYPFRIFDLLAIVLVLSLGLTATVDVLERLSGIGLIRESWEHEAFAYGGICQCCLISTSILVGGAALGLRHCALLKTERPLARVLTTVAGMLALPAAAGTVAFLVPVFSALSQAPAQALLWALLWLMSIVVTGANAVLFIKTLTLQEEIKAQEKMP